MELEVFPEDWERGLAIVAHPDGLVENNVALRRDLAEAIRRHHHPDHRAVGRAILDAVRDAANPWLFTDIEPRAWDGAHTVAFSASTSPSHALGGDMATPFEVIHV
ncbi:MAG: LmbE family N-acetylglucosaminyl deacetylase [Verrucomicrobiales bacterium]|jgi:LmbE family N-acetylglucosaminyl deacetylase